MDFGSIAKKAQDALTDGTAEKALRENAAKVGSAAEKLLRDNAPRIESAAEALAGFAKDKLPGRAAQIDQVVAKVKDVVPGGSGASATDGPATPGPTAASPTPEVDRAAAAAADPQSTVPTTPPAPPSPTPEVDRVARAQDLPE